MSELLLEQRVSAGMPDVTVWRLTLPGGATFDRYARTREMVDDRDGTWRDVQDLGRQLAHLEAQAEEIVGPPPFGLPRGLLEPKLLEQAVRVRQEIVVALFPFDVVLEALEVAVS